MTGGKSEKEHDETRWNDGSGDGGEEKRRVNETGGKERVRCYRDGRTIDATKRTNATLEKNEREEFITSICKPLFVTMIVNKMENTVCNECVPEFHPSSWFIRYDLSLFSRSSLFLRFFFSLYVYKNICDRGSICIYGISK